MIRASSLFYALVIALLIATTSGSLILALQLNSVQLLYHHMDNRMLMNCKSGMEILLAGEQSISNEKIWLDLFDEGKDSVILVRKPWGLYEIGISKATYRSRNKTKVALFGTRLNENSRIALYLADQNRPLSLCGKTVIKGKCYLPKAGVKRAYIEGQNFAGSALIQGTQLRSQKQLPALDEELISRCSDYLEGRFAESDSIISYEEELSDSLTQSFLNPTVLVYSQLPILLDREVIRGNVILVSETSITISGASQLTDVQLYAPEINIEKGFKGKIQAFASQQLVLGENVVLDFPSVIGLIDLSPATSEAGLQIKTGAQLTGIAFCYDQWKSKQLPRLTIDEEATVEGQVYADGLVELKGRIAGSLYCKRIILNTPSSVYENHLLNATINFAALSTHFAGANLVHFSDHKQIARWLY